MSNDSAEKRQAFERWVSTLRTGPASPVAAGEESGITSLDDQKTLVQRLPKDVVRALRERGAGRHLDVDPDSTAIFQPPPELLARARRLVPPKKPERSVPPSTPPEPLSEPLPTPVVAAPLDAEPVVLPELQEPPLPTLADAAEWDDPPAAVHFPRDPNAQTPQTPDELVLQPTRASRFVWMGVVLLGVGILAACAWFLLMRSDW